MKVKSAKWLTTLAYCAVFSIWSGCLTVNSGMTAQEEAERFFEEFTLALKNNDAAMAAIFVAPDRRDRFKEGYRSWRGCRFFDAKVLESSAADGLLRVVISFECPSGAKDREIMTLRRIAGKWRLLDS